METAIQVFLTTSAVVLGILAPVIVVAFIVIVASVARGVGPAMALRAEEDKKKPPFDDVEANLSPTTNILTVRFRKNGNVIYEGSATRNNLGVSNEKTE